MGKETGEQPNVGLHSFFWSSLMAGLLTKSKLPESSTAVIIHEVPPLRSDSPDQDGGTSSEGSETKGDSRPPSPSMVDSLFRFAVPLLKSDCSDIREAVIVGLGRTSPCSYRELIEELHFLLREALDRRAESVRRRRKRDVLRAYLVRIFELNAEHGCFRDSASELVMEDGLCATFIEYIDGTRSYLESESEKDMPAIMQLRLHFAHFLYKMITLGLWNEQFFFTSVTHAEYVQSELLFRGIFYLRTCAATCFSCLVVGVPTLESRPLDLKSSVWLVSSVVLFLILIISSPVVILTTRLQTVLNSPKERSHHLGHDTLVHLLENNANIQSLSPLGYRQVLHGCVACEMTARFEMTSPVGQRCILQYMLPWLANIELVDLSNSSPTPPELNIETDEEEQTSAMSPVELEGEGWGSVEATQLVLNNLFYITVKYDEQFSKEIEEAWGSLCGSRWVNNIHEILGYLIALAGVIGSSEVLVHAKKLAVYVARANQQKTIEELMEETQEACHASCSCVLPVLFLDRIMSSTSRDSVSEVQSGEGSRSLAQKASGQQENVSNEDTKLDRRWEAVLQKRIKRREKGIEERDEMLRDERKEKGDSLPRGLGDMLPCLSRQKHWKPTVPLAEPGKKTDQIEEEEKPEGAWAT
ncbi:hypothetical protein OS493_008413 [Desmophyllum pertusum]|uniref:Uncharacterized protein n=1 Tax=Desmophyllum pertusum TaxID=174260 RepID=A0A9X0A7S9_9CNID|nr:hypothetical protein OS493_008413 [Desmophyllum pertusum]